MSGGTRRGGIPGPESRTGLVRPAMTEAEFERRQREAAAVASVTSGAPSAASLDPAEMAYPSEPEVGARSSGPARARAARAKPAKPRRVQRMFALEEDLDK